MIPLARQYYDERRFAKGKDIVAGRHSCGDMVVCKRCNALMFLSERIKGKGSVAFPRFSLCCKGGAVTNIPTIDPDPVLLRLLLGPDRTHFLKYIRLYNSDLSFTSIGAELKQDLKINQSGGPWVYRVHGIPYHLLGRLTPNVPNGGEINPGDSQQCKDLNAKFAQVWVSRLVKDLNHSCNTSKSH